MFWKLIGVIAAGLTSFAFIPQVLKMHTTKSAKDSKPGNLNSAFPGVSLWMVYGIYLKDYIIILANAVTLLTLLSALFLYYKYRK